jgi:hypothetical protein
MSGGRGFASKSIYGFVRFFIFPFLVIFGIFCSILLIPFLGTSFDFNPLIIFSLGYALFFSAPFLFQRFGSLIGKHQNFDPLKSMGNKQRLQLKKIYVALAVLALTAFSIYTIQAVSYQISYIPGLTFPNTTIYLSAVSAFFIAIFAFIFYYGKNSY